MANPGPVHRRGGEKADRQAIFDAMLAASPAFFKGKTLKEAAPNVFEAIAKSGAFDKPQKIRQAAAELAIQRELMLDKIKQQEETRGKLLGINLATKQSFGKDLSAKRPMRAGRKLRERN